MMESTKQKIAVLLTVHNRKDKTVNCLANIYNQHIPKNIQIDVYLTNDGCTDGTPKIVTQKFPQVHIVEGDGNLFWNRGMYKAWCAAETSAYDYYLWLNDDTMLMENSIASLLDASDKCANIAIIVGYTLDSSKKRITYGGRDKFKGLITNVSGLTQCDTFNGNIVLIPNYVYSIVGKNDPTFHHAIGDTDYGLRAQKAGIDSYISPVVCGICDTHEKLPKWCDKNVPLFRRIKFLYSPGGNGANPIEFFIYKRRHYGFIAAISTLVSNHLHLLFPKLWKKDASKY